ncbi:YdeI family protein [Aquabacterium sp.]|uniref:YdeI/OmpD-associated family protein n=1 Tax=Aquabacterium sp. TaxID=1872578 RepID=UPI003784FD04
MPKHELPAPYFFASPAEFRAWLLQHGASRTELLVGFHKRHTGAPSMTWPESVDEALCVGWIDGVRKRIDEERYQIRFTPRKPGSTWSAINIERMQVLIAVGRVQAAGLAAFALRQETKSRIYSYEQRQAAELEPAQQAAFKKHRAAWAFFEQQPPGYRQQMIWRITSAKQAATRERRLQWLIEACREKRRLE